MMIVLIVIAYFGLYWQLLSIQRKLDDIETRQKAAKL
jgi:hypothetical protein